jgi:hypothetical protein
MIPALTIRPRQLKRERWSLDRLIHECALALLHHLPAEPTDDTLSLFTVYTAHYIKPDSVDSYLSGIAHQLEPFFPDVQKAHSSPLVKRTLRGCKCMQGTAITWKRVLTLNDLRRVINFYAISTHHDDLLFVVMLLTSFFALMRLGELTLPNDKSIHDWRKVTKRRTVCLHHDSYEFHLPHHKADLFFKGNCIIIHCDQFQHNPLHHFCAYLSSCL